MAKLNISSTLTPEQKASVKEHLNAIKDILNFTVGLTPKERKTLFKMGPKSVQFVELALKIAQEHPAIIPPGFNVTEFAKDVALASDLVEVEIISTTLAESINDTLQICLD
jgi:hypothetical protein